MTRFFQIIREEFEGLHIRLLLIQIVVKLLPPFVGNRLRRVLLRSAGFRIGKGTVFWGNISITGTGNLKEQLTIGKNCWFNDGCVLELGAEINIGEQVAVGQEVMILTNAHRIGGPARRAGLIESKSVTIGNGAWLSTRSIILPGVTIGAGAVVAAGAVVTKSVAPNEMVGGVPARTIRLLSEDEAVGYEQASLNQPIPNELLLKQPVPDGSRVTYLLADNPDADRRREIL